MITIRKAAKEDTSSLTLLYNQADKLFPEVKRADGTDDIFQKIMEDDVIYLLFEGDIPAAFIAYHEYDDYLLITALYVDTAYQRKGYGKILLSYFENLNYYLEKYYIVKVLVNAPWAIDFYLKHGYDELLKHSEIKLEGITSEPWSKVLFKILQQENTGGCMCGCRS